MRESCMEKKEEEKKERQNLEESEGFSMEACRKEAGESCEEEDRGAVQRG